MKTSTIILIVVALAVVGVGLYFVFGRKKTAAAPYIQSPAKAAEKSYLQQLEEGALGFGINELKKAWA